MESVKFGGQNRQYSTPIDVCNCTVNICSKADMKVLGWLFKSQKTRRISRKSLKKFGKKSSIYYSQRLFVGICQKKMTAPKDFVLLMVKLVKDHT